MGQFIVRSVKYGFSKGELSITQGEGIITCIPKENKPWQFVKNYRPISLLNCVYKITSGVIVHRIKAHYINWYTLTKQDSLLADI